MVGDRLQWTWLHQPSGIQLWRDALDLSDDAEQLRVYFHYTSDLVAQMYCVGPPFAIAKNITLTMVYDTQITSNNYIVHRC